MAEKGVGGGGERREIYQREIKWEGSVVRNGRKKIRGEVGCVGWRGRGACGE